MTQRLRAPLAWMALGLAALLIGATATVVSQEAVAEESSAVTKKGDEAFPNLEVTVSKTKQLRDEVIRVSWKGGAPTESNSVATGFERNFLQIMQCWGDAPAGPKPEQCTFGAIIPVQGDPQLGFAVATRQVRGNLLPADPKETREPDAEGRAYVPFDPVDGNPVGGTFRDFNVYFDFAGTNEIDLGRTHADGRGEEIFNVQTAAEAPGLGCGKVVSLPGSGKGPRGCWLVVVPRGDREVDGSPRLRTTPGQPADRILQTSPLSASNWEHRLLFPLEFRAIPEPCAQGGTSTTALGQDNVTEAFTNWQPVLCATTKTVFDYNEVPDGVGRGKLAGTDPALSIVGAPPSAEAVPKDAVLAPIAISGLVIAYNWDVQAIDRDPEKVRALGGTRMPDGLKLTPRLVLKLLTQSYRLGSPTPLHLGGNPLRIEDDPEFQELNKNLFGDLGIQQLNRGAANHVFTILTTINPTDINRTLWAWIKADPEARSFLAGENDGHGMHINPEYKDMDLDRDDFPKLDTTCEKGDQNQNPIPPDLCTLDKFPYAGSLAEGARSALKGDTLARTTWDPTALPPAYRKDAPQGRAQRAIMALTDTANAARFDLRAAALRNANGKFVKPTASSMLAAVNAWAASSIPGVLTPNPMARGDGVYPLTNVSYAAVRPAGSAAASAAQNAAARRAYASFLEYAIGPGQKSGEALGQLPMGYVPLPPAMVRVGTAAVRTIRNFKPTTSSTPRPTPRPSGGGGSSGGGDSSSGAGSSGGGSPSPGTSTPVPVPTDTPADEVPPGTDAPLTDTPTPALPTVTTAITPTSGVGSRARHSLIWVLVAGLAAGVAARTLPHVIAARARPGAARSAPPMSGRTGPGPTPPGGDAGA